MIKNYLEEIDGYEEFTIGCIKADIEDVRKLISAKNTELDSEVMYAELEGGSSAIMLVQAKDSDWTIVIYHIGYYIQAGTPHLVDLSKKLNADAILHAKEDTSFTEAFEFYRSGKTTNYIECHDGSKMELEIILNIFEGEFSGNYSDDLLPLGEMADVYQAFDIKPLVAVFDDGIMLQPKCEPFLKSVFAYDGQSFDWGID